MNTGIQILIERMKTNPEEWSQIGINSRGKWENTIALFWDYLPEEDQAAYKAARHALLADEFTEVVMKKLAGVGEDDGVALSSKTLPPNIGSLRINHSTNQYEVFDGKSWVVVDPTQQVILNPSNPMYGQQAMAQQQYGAGGSGGGTIYAGGGGDGGSMLGNLAKNLGFK